jgi:hypothetical protein
MKRIQVQKSLAQTQFKNLPQWIQTPFGSIHINKILTSYVRKLIPANS